MKILIIQQKMIGDVLTSSILFEALNVEFPEAQLDYLINEHTSPVIKHHPFINHVIYYTKKEAKSKKALFRFAQRIKKEKYDIVIDVYSKFSSNVISYISSANIRISKYKWYSAFIYTHTFADATTPKTPAGLAIENRLQLLKPILNYKPKNQTPKIYLTPEELKHSKAFLLNHGLDLLKPIYMISVLGSSQKKTYPFNYMAELLDALVIATQGQILFNYIPNQEEDAKAIYNTCKPETQQHIKFDVFGKSLREFIAITKHCTALIGNEGGAVNMAKAIDVPTFTIFSPWITKAAWNMFEDGKTHVSIHLNDLKPELYTNTSKKYLKANYKSLYKAFTPNLIVDQLKLFLEEN
ncbi:glycosyltransferase family 9 protein [Neotamlana laminarinivorans]|uniref:Glycosyltransferase family 9 protein n=1 Tax=Neotamlana laminarinivorans TaxID=2883124 RepID=A0A9X1L1R2_9FLAO|nr:glycosyltransferase family 9 protein [Tamlana laminarinivorans]MCB4798975.1 glycosyltransferase family 9 protein [Tamlana laminarinivorans]